MRPPGGRALGCTPRLPPLAAPGEKRSSAPPHCEGGAALVKPGGAGAQRAVVTKASSCGPLLAVSWQTEAVASDARSTEVTVLVEKLGT